MSDFADFLAGIETEGITAGAEKLVVGGAVRVGLAAGLSANQMLTDLTEAGFGLRRQDFLSLVRSMRAEAAAGLGGESAFATAVPEAGNIGAVAMGRAGTYVTNVRVTYRVSNEEGPYSIEERVISVTSQRPISPADAAGVVQDIWGQHAANYPALTLLDMSYLGTVLHTGAA